MYITVFFFSIWLIEQRWNWNNDNHRYNSFSTSTKLKCTEKSKSAVKNALKIERKKKYHHWKKTSPRTRKKCKKAKVRHYRDPELKRQYQKRKYQKKSWTRKRVVKDTYQENPKLKKRIWKKKYCENPEQREYEKKKIGKILNQKKEIWKKRTWERSSDAQWCTDFHSVSSVLI